MNADERIIECEGAGLPPNSRLCRICMGLIYDIHTTNGYRAIWGLPPLDNSDIQIPKKSSFPKRVPEPKSTASTTLLLPSVVPLQTTPKQSCGSCNNQKLNVLKPNGYGPGSQLLKLWDGMPHCDACITLAAQMDEWGVEGCEDNFDTIIDDILPRAKSWLTENHNWVQNLLRLVDLDELTLRFAISRYVKQAIKKSALLYEPQDESDKIAVVIPYFNFTGSQNRNANYFRTVNHLIDRGFPVFTVEVALSESEFHIPEGPRVKHYIVNAPMFMYANLFNLCVKDLPDKYTMVAWPDADVIFDRPDIVDATISALDDYPIVQMFKFVTWLGPDGRPERRRRQNYASLAYSRMNGRSNSIGRWPGLAWAARREVLDSIGGLYDAYPAGSHDVLAIGGFYGLFDKRRFARYSPATMQHYNIWRKNTFNIIKGRVGYVDTKLSHLYHGSYSNRQYSNRHKTLFDHNFDPQRHLVNGDGLYRLSDECPREIRNSLRKYMMELRKEDELLGVEAKSTIL